MHLTRCQRNEFGKCDHPLSTLERIRDGFRRLGVDDINYNDRGWGAWTSKGLYWGVAESLILRTSTTGKGTSRLMSCVSAYAELAERFSTLYCFSHFDTVNLLYLVRNADAFRRYFAFSYLAGYQEAHQDEVASPVPLEDLLANERHLTQEDLEIIKRGEQARHWVDGFSLLHGRKVKIAPVMVRYLNGTNGIAAGNTIEEAIVHACCEVFERYAQRKVIARETVPTIDAQTIENPELRALLASFEQDGVRIILKDFSERGLLPCIGVLTVNNNIPKEHVEYRIIQIGSSFDPEEALMRCFTERVQGRLNYSPSDKFKDMCHTDPENVTDHYFFLTDRVTQADLSFLEEGERVPFLKGERPGDCLEEVEAIKRICRRLGTDLVVVDHTHPVLRFPVVRVVMPGVSDAMVYYPNALRTRDKYLSLIESTCAYEKGILERMESFWAGAPGGLY